jgi:signal transduction histidine kinase
VERVINVLIQKYLEFMPATPLSSNAFREWRYHLMNRRISLVTWIALPCTFSYLIFDLWVDSLDLVKFPYQVAEISRFALTLLCFGLHRSRWGKAHPKWVFVFFSWSITLFPNLISRQMGDQIFTPVAHLLTFLTQTTLLPFHWWLHGLTQMIAIAYRLTFLHSTDTIPPSDLGLMVLFWLWFVLISVTSVYIVERLQHSDFESRRELQGLLHAVCHDLRTPMMGSALVLQRLLTKASNEQIQVNRDLLQQLRQGIDRQLLLLDTLLEANRVKQTPLTRTSVQMQALVESVLTDLDEMLSNRNILVKTQIQRKLPVVEADQAQIYRVFSNLISNVLNHNPPGTTLSLAITAEPQQIYCCVQDNGVGIPKAKHQQVFKPYTRGLQNQYSPGLGIGLSVCKQMIEAHRGEIGITEALGGGTAVWFTLPLNTPKLNLSGERQRQFERDC